jgi:hypothetical protein
MSAEQGPDHNEQDSAPGASRTPHLWTSPSADQPGARYAPSPPPPPAPPVPARQSSLTTLIVGLAGVAVILLAGGIVAVSVAGDRDQNTAAAPRISSPSSGTSSAAAAPTSTTLRSPKSIGSYRRETGNVAKRLIDDLRKDFADTYRDADKDASKMKAAVYSNDDDDFLIFIGFTVVDSPGIGRELRSKSPSYTVDMMALGAGISNTKDFPTGPLGGILRCGQQRKEQGAMCVWATQEVIGMLLSVELPHERLAKITLKFRKVAERR